MDGKLHRSTRRSKNRAEYYYFFAEEFGWDKEKVDRQPVEYLAGLIKIHLKNSKRHEQTKPPPLPRKFRKLK